MSKFKLLCFSQLSIFNLLPQRQRWQPVCTIPILDRDRPGISRIESSSVHASDISDRVSSPQNPGSDLARIPTRYRDVSCDCSGNRDFPQIYKRSPVTIL